MSRVLSRYKCTFIKDLIIVNKIYARQFSAFAKGCKKCDTLLNQRVWIVPNIHPCNRREFIGFVPDRKDGYKTQKELSEKEHMKSGLKQLKTELKLWTEEMKEELRSDPMLIAPEGKSRNIAWVLFCFRSNCIFSLKLFVHSVFRWSWFGVWIRASRRYW